MTLHFVMPMFPGSWASEYGRAVPEEFERRGFRVARHIDRFITKRLYSLAQARPRPNDVLFFATHTDPLILVAEEQWPKTPRFAHMHNIPDGPFATEMDGLSSLLTDCTQVKTVFLNSEYQRGLTARVGVHNTHVSGFPVDYAALPLLVSPRNDEVWLTQRFSLDKNAPLLVRLLPLLQEKGWTVHQCIGATRQAFQEQFGYLAYPLRKLEEHGLVLHFNDSRGAYLECLKRAGRVLFLSVEENLSVAAIEASAAGARVVAPRLFAFPEMLGESRLYDPYSMKDILKKLPGPIPLQGKLWRRTHERYSVRSVVGEYVQGMKDFL